ncbi:C45 family peptidase [Pollutibacter soli]|uniref:C45 family peptidase n=1 Tax=Pollutibacter soli TaxID=3034157 RepID=UPI0030136BF6
MPKTRKIFRWVLYFIGTILLLCLGLFIYVSIVSKTEPPLITNRAADTWQREDKGEGFYTLKNSWFRKSKSGLYEMYVEGNPYEMGVINGKLSKELVVNQEIYFNEQISKMIPSKSYLHFLKYFVGWFNRHLDKNVSDEYRKEIYGVSQSASGDFGYIGTPYQRILNYHAAHDIGHALQSMALVGCTSFGTWDNLSADGTMIIGRNFDFYVGDKFATDKIVAFYHPSTGNRFMTVTWGGFIGAVSGMNEKGLTVTINAAKTAIPSGAETPVSLVAREILQYAGNIEEAKKIAASRKMFVSESFLVASAADHKAVVIEKTPEAMDVYDPGKDYIVCANHFQGSSLVNTVENQEQIHESASEYRYKRLQQLLDSNGKNTVEKTIGILRDQKGINNRNIGMGNEKAINQLIAHHSIVFEPEKRLVWVSTSPWQLGEYVAYDLNKVFGLAGKSSNEEISDSSLRVPADSFLQTKSFADFERFRSYRKRILDHQPVNADSIVASNPEYYHAWVLAGDESFRKEDYQKAMQFYAKALTKEIATKKEYDYIHGQMEKTGRKIEKSL